MTAKQLKMIMNDTEKFIRNSEKMVLDYQEKKKKDGVLIEKQMKGLNQVRKELDDIQKSYKEEAETTKEKLVERLDNFMELIKAITDEEKQPVKQDDLAELTLIGMLNPTLNEMNEYAIKYRKNPLALRLIQKIANEKELMVTVPMTRVDFAEKVISKMKRDIQYHSQPKVTLPTAHVNMVADGDIDMIQRLHKEYADLEEEIKKS